MLPSAYILIMNHCDIHTLHIMIYSTFFTLVFTGRWMNQISRFTSALAIPWRSSQPQLYLRDPWKYRQQWNWDSFKQTFLKDPCNANWFQRSRGSTIFSRADRNATIPSTATPPTSSSVRSFLKLPSHAAKSFYEVMALRNFTEGVLYFLYFGLLGRDRSTRIEAGALDWGSTWRGSGIDKWIGFQGLEASQLDLTIFSGESGE